MVFTNIIFVTHCVCVCLLKGSSLREEVQFALCLSVNG